MLEFIFMGLEILFVYSVHVVRVGWYEWNLVPWWSPL